MELRVMGALLLVGVACYVGFLFSSIQSGRQRRLESFLQLVRQIENEISCFQTPLEDIYHRFSCDELERCGFLECLRSKGMLQALHEKKHKLCFSDEEWQLLVEFAKELGISYREEQLRGCAYYRRRLEEYCTRGREALPARLKLCRSLALTGGLLVAVMLL